MNTEIPVLLGRVPLFQGLDVEQLEEIATWTRRRRIAGSMCVFREGEPGQKLYLIISGHIHIEKTSATGQTVHLATCGPGECFGELALIDGAPRMADAVTADPCELLELERRHFLQCLEATPQIALAVMTSLAQRLRSSGDNLVTGRALDVRGRLARVLLQLARTHGHIGPRGEVALTAKFTHQELANQAGTTRESVTRALVALRRARLVECHGRRMTLLDVSELRRISRF